MHEIKISQLGEGLTEVRVIALLKKEGDLLAKDELLLEVETDKAVMEIETSCAGRLEKWMVSVGDLVPVGATVALVNQSITEREVRPSLPTPSLPASTNLAAPVRNRTLSPREKARLQREEQQASPLPTVETQPSNAQIWEISPRQLRLGHLLSESQTYTVEVWLSMSFAWDDLSSISRGLRNLQGLEYRPAPLEIIAWCVVRAMEAHPKFRLLNNGPKGYELQNAASLGISVAIPDDELAITGVSSTTVSDFSGFIRAIRTNVAEAQKGRTPSGRYPLIVSYMAQQGVSMAVPRIVLPSVATLFIGAPVDTPTKAPDGTLVWRRFSNFGLTFDHRVINGAGATAFLKEVISNLKKMHEGDTSLIGE